MPLRSDPRWLVLFDLDHTLVDLSAEHHVGFRAALRVGYGFIGDYDGRQHGGETWPNAMRAVLGSAGWSEPAIEARLQDSQRLAHETIVDVLAADLRHAVLPGVPALLQALRQCNHAMAVGTGSLSPTVEVILDRAGLAGFFTARACGDEALQRVDVWRLAMERAARASGRPYLPSETVLIGDTPRDIHAARLIGARAVSVATGAFDIHQLVDHQPDAVLPTLENTKAALDAILG